MYAGAIDERMKCVVPTCSVGTYQAYSQTACQCEVVPGAFRFTEEGDVLACRAPWSDGDQCHNGFVSVLSGGEEVVVASRNRAPLPDCRNQTHDH